MKKYTFLFLLLIMSYPLFGQLDLEHWFPPVYRTAKVTNPSELEINISTPHEKEFRVFVYTRGGLKQTFTISKDNPAKYIITDDDYIGAGFTVMKVKDTGIHLVGENSFYADLRFYQDIYSEMIFSKGKSALGTSFMSINTNIEMYDDVGRLSFMTSVMASKNNTKIKLSGYDPKITFIDGSKSPIKEITLNKGESYVFVALKADNFNIYDNEYFNSINGAKIESDKPIVVISGGFNTQYAYESGSGSTLLEQIVPIKQLGKQFFLTKGFSDIKKHTEKAFIVATKDNTQLFFNNSTSPEKTLKSGEYFLTPINLFSGNNMYIRSTEPIYCMQLAAGTNKGVRGADFSYITETMSYLHPLEKSLPGEIDKLIAIDKIGNHTYRNFLNIVTPTGNTLLINNQTPDKAAGPFPIVGTDEYQYYSIKDYIGDAKITSENGLVATIIGGNSNYLHGWSSSTTGFSNDPYIIKNGNCLEEDVELRVSNIDFDGFQWQKNKINIVGATDATFYPKDVGYYRCILSYSGVTYTTEEVFIDHCPYIVIDKELGNVCNTVTGILNFSPPNTNLPVDKVRILTPPNNGKVTINNSDKTFTYIANVGYKGPDRFVYEICTSSNSLCESVKASLNVLESPTEEFKESITAISTNTNFSTYDLTQARLDTANSNDVTYYEDKSLKNIITNYTNYNTNSSEVFAKISNLSTICYTVATINLIPLPIIPDADLILPNFFSPNGDDINDVYDFSILKPMLNVHVVITDRYGKKVFENTEENFIWTGKNTDNKPLPSTAYWAVFSWTSPKTKITTIRKQWILLKQF